MRPLLLSVISCCTCQVYNSVEEFLELLPRLLRSTKHKLRDGRPAAQSRPVQWPQATEEYTGGTFPASGSCWHELLLDFAAAVVPLSESFSSFSRYAEKTYS